MSDDRKARGAGGIALAWGVSPRKEDEPHPSPTRDAALPPGLARREGGVPGEKLGDRLACSGPGADVQIAYRP